MNHHRIRNLLIALAVLGAGAAITVSAHAIWYCNGAGC